MFQISCDLSKVVHPVPTGKTEDIKKTASRKEDLVSIHQHARLNPQSRADVVRRVLAAGRTPEALPLGAGFVLR